jgi:ABC-2 type transport system permease protein
VSLLLGQIVLYYLTLLIDLLCFWTIQNNSALLILQFAQNLLSGAYAPLWFFPGWFVAMSAVLPFQSTLNVPLSLYIGRIPLSDLPAQLAVQAVWVLLLALLTRLLWRRAAARVVSQGG